jgi:hypothetical protein
VADEPKPPYVRFEIRPEEDRAATIKAGHYVGNDVVYAIVTPAGTKDRIEKKVDDWLANLEEGVKQERVPESWLHHYRRKYEDYKASRETPETGAPIKDWPSVTPAQVNSLLDMGITTVELLAEANEEALARLGMGARALKQKAVIWLESSNEQGKLVEKMNALEIENLELKERDKERDAQIKKLQAQVEALTVKASKKEDA